MKKQGRQARYPFLDMPAFQMALPHGFAEFEAGDPMKPTVVLLGWWGCSDRHLRKYADLYKSMGHSTLRYRERPADLLRHKQRRGTVENLASHLGSSRTCRQRGVVVHAFSNGGGFMYEAILKSAQFRGLIRGVIFDSCPGTLNVQTLYLVLREMFAKRSRLKRAALDVAFLALPVLLAGAAARRVLLQRRMRVAQRLRWAVAALVCAGLWWNQERRNRAYWDAFRGSTTTVPELFLYSEDDKLCGSRGIDSLVKVRELAGVPVMWRRWAKSKHVGHMVCHEKE